MLQQYLKKKKRKEKKSKEQQVFFSLLLPDLRQSLIYQPVKRDWPVLNVADRALIPSIVYQLFPKWTCVIYCGLWTGEAVHLASQAVQSKPRIHQTEAKQLRQGWGTNDGPTPIHPLFINHRSTFTENFELRDLVSVTMWKRWDENPFQLHSQKETSRIEDDLHQPLFRSPVKKTQWSYVGLRIATGSSIKTDPGDSSIIKTNIPQT